MIKAWWREADAACQPPEVLGPASITGHPGAGRGGAGASSPGRRASSAWLAGAGCVLAGEGGSGGAVGKGVSGCLQSQPQPPTSRPLSWPWEPRLLTPVLAPSSDCLKRKYSLLSTSVLTTKRVISPHTNQFSNSVWSLREWPAAQSSADTVCLELVSDPIVKGSAPQDCRPMPVTSSGCHLGS